LRVFLSLLRPEALLQHFAQLRRADLLAPAAAQLLCRRYI
jgi:hypothetical protein